VQDVHDRFRTEAHQDVVGRFNERFLLSLQDVPSCLLLDDTLDVLPWAHPQEPLAAPDAPAVSVASCLAVERRGAGGEEGIGRNERDSERMRENG
jgi:tRNA(Met) C34 N-acetyltransferase TmcA